MKSVTAIITTHNREPEVLQRAIDSVVNQSYPVSEIIVVDDSPTYIYHDQISELINSYRVHIKYFINTLRQHACVSRNHGIRMATGEYIAFLDDDDSWIEDKIRILLPYFTEDIGMVYGDYSVYKNGNLKCKRKETKYDGEIFNELIKHRNFIGGCSIPIIKKSALLKVGLFDESLSSGQDYDLWLRISEKYLVKYVNCSTTNYYYSKDSISTISRNRIEGRLQILEKYKAQMECFYGVVEKNVKDIIYYMVVDKQYHEAVEIAKTYNIGKDIIIRTFLKGIIKRLLIKLRVHNR